MELSEELKEHAEEARGPFDRKVAVSMAIIAAALAIATVLGHIATTEELVNQQRAADQWAFYQAKAMRRYQSEIAGVRCECRPVSARKRPGAGEGQGVRA